MHQRNLLSELRVRRMVHIVINLQMQQSQLASADSACRVCCSSSGIETECGRHCRCLRFCEAWWHSQLFWKRVSTIRRHVWQLPRQLELMFACCSLDLWLMWLAGTRSAVFPLLKSKQQTALATLLQRVSGRRPSAPPRIDSCAVKAIVCDSDGNVVEINHELAQIASGQAATTHVNSRGPWMLNGASLSKLPFLRSLELNACRLQGTVPPQIGSLHDMTSIMLFDNQLTGSLPSSIGSLVNLRTLVVSSNKFRGKIPASLAQSQQIRHLDAAFNSFNGPFPDSATEALVALHDVRLNDNRAFFCLEHCLPRFNTPCNLLRV